MNQGTGVSPVMQSLTSIGRSINRRLRLPGMMMPILARIRCLVNANFACYNVK